MSTPAAVAARHLTFHRTFLPVWDVHAQAVAVRCGDVEHTFAEHRDRVFRIANALAALGLDHGGRFAVLALKSAEYLELYHAAYFGAGVINPLNIRLAASELEFILADSETEIVFVDSRFAPVIAALRARVPSIRLVVLIGDGPADTPGIDHAYDELIATASAAAPAETDEGDPACLMYTGGTTGSPKGVVHTQRSHVLMSQIGRPLFNLGPDRTFLATTPLFHGASLAAFNIAPAVGCPVVVLPMFTPDGFLDLCEAAGATNTVLVPTMARMVIDSPNFDPGKLRSLRSFLYGGSPMPLGLLSRLLDALPDVDIVQAYGMTEGVPVSCLDGREHRRGGDALRSAGRAIPGVQLCVQDPLGETLPPGQAGEVCIRSGLLMDGYWKRPAETTAAFRGGWYHTGDVGYLDPNGYLFLVDRAKDMIVTGGENVYSSEVESAISTHPAVLDVAVIGIPSDEWGEAVHAVVVVADRASLTPEDVVTHTRALIAGYKVPRTVEVRTDPLPVSGAGKTLKRELREPHWVGIDRRIS